MGYRKNAFFVHLKGFGSKFPGSATRLTSRQRYALKHKLAANPLYAIGVASNLRLEEYKFCRFHDRPIVTQDHFPSGRLDYDSGLKESRAIGNRNAIGVAIQNCQFGVNTALAFYQANVTGKQAIALFSVYDAVSTSSNLATNRSAVFLQE
jgi:hypothetical protein